MSLYEILKTTSRKNWIKKLIVGADGVQPQKTHSESTAFTNCFTKKPHRSFVKQDPDPH